MKRGSPYWERKQTEQQNQTKMKQNEKYRAAS